MTFAELLEKYPDETTRAAITEAYQLGFNEGVQSLSDAFLVAKAKVYGAELELNSSGFALSMPMPFSGVGLTQVGNQALVYETDSDICG
jgi:hypothetical protein